MSDISRNNQLMLLKTKQCQRLDKNPDGWGYLWCKNPAVIKQDGFWLCEEHMAEIRKGSDDAKKIRQTD